MSCFLRVPDHAARGSHCLTGKWAWVVFFKSVSAFL